MARELRITVFALFFVSGFCSLAYEVIWLRLAFASFGTITAIVSVVISVFMAGLAIGSFLGARWISSLVAKTRLSPILFYGISECAIGLGSIAVPRMFKAGEQMLLGMGQSNSAAYLITSAVVIAISILPWTTCMGTTFPWMMTFIRTKSAKEQRSFSHLYLANICGAALGAWLTAYVLIELNGFSATLSMAGLLNVCSGLACILIGIKSEGSAKTRARAKDEARAEPRPRPGQHKLQLILFATGFISMGLEAIWTRSYAGMMGTTVYAFAFILTTYLIGTGVGTLLYRLERKGRESISTSDLLYWAAPAAALPVVLNDPRFGLLEVGLVCSIVPISTLFGYLTPRLVDAYSEGHPRQAGVAYGLNVLGCIFGPLVASYALLPHMIEREAMALEALALLAAAVAYRKPGKYGLASLPLTAALVGLAVFWNSSYNEGPPTPERIVRTDYTATVVSAGHDLMKTLTVNGVGMTTLTPLTKMMVHMPLALRPRRPESILIICFGMGTSFRSALTWGAKTTAVELVSGVRDAFPFYHADTQSVLADPNGQIIVDDGRRFLKRTHELYDLIVLDPPPPVTSAGSGMLYSKEFYEIAKTHLKQGGLLQQWSPTLEVRMAKAMLRSILEVFPYVRIFRGYFGGGLHFIASLEPIPTPTAGVMLDRLSSRSREDLLEWFTPQPDGAKKLMVNFLKNEVPVKELLSASDGRTQGSGPAPEVTDDQPYNEYYKLRDR